MIDEDWISQLIASGYNILPLNLGDGAKGLLSQYTSFLSATEDVRRQILMNNEREIGLLPDVGLEDQLIDPDLQERKDFKQTFHFAPNFKEELLGHRKMDFTCMALERLLESSSHFYDESSRLSRDIILAVGRQLGRLDQFERSLTSAQLENRNRLRLLLYLYVSGRSAGRMHSDRAFLTLHFFSSGPLLLEDRLGNRLEYHSSPDTVLVFFGDKAPLATGGKLLNGAVTNNHGKKEISQGQLGTILHQPLNPEVIEDHRKACVFFVHIPLDRPRDISPDRWYGPFQ